MTRGQRLAAVAIVLALFLTTIIMALAGSPPREPERRAFLDPPGSMGGDHTVPSISPDPRVVWLTFNVAGCILVNPAVTDSSGRNTVMELPPGAMLVIPLLVPDTSGGGQADQPRGSLVAIDR